MNRNANASRPGDSGRGRTVLGRPSRWRAWMTWSLSISAFSVGISTVRAQMPNPPAGQIPPNPINLPNRPNQLPDSKAPPAPAVDTKGLDLVLPPPKPLEPPPGPMQKVGPRTGQDRPLGYTPRPSAPTAEKLQRYFLDFVDTEATMELIQGRTRLLNLKESPTRIQVDDDGIVEYSFLAKDQIVLQGRAQGVTTIRMWFTNTKETTKTDILSYYVRVLPDPEEKERIRRAYKQLQDEINCHFPDSVICISLVGEKIIVTGHAKDTAEVAQIMRIIRANTNGGAAAHGRNRAGTIATDRQQSGRDPNNPSEPANSPPLPGLEEYIVDGNNNVINMIRVTGEQTVSMRVTVAEVNRTAARSVGMNFTLLNNQGQPYFASNAGLIATGGQSSNGQIGIGMGGGGSLSSCIPVCPGLPAGAGGFNNLPFAVDNGQVRFAVSALRNLDYAKLLAEPLVTTINGQTANFRAGGQFPTPILASGSGGTNGQFLQGVQFQNYGVDISFTPYITDRDRIRLVLNADITALDVQQGQSNIGGANIPFLKQRSVNTTVEMREGQTLAVAGLIQNNLTGDAHRVPFLGDMPFVGNLFGFNRVSAGEQELLILIQPQLVHPIDCRDRLPLPGHDLYEPTDFEFYLLGRIESHRTADFRSPVRTDIGRIKQYQQMEASYIAGPSGYSESCGENR